MTRKAMAAGVCALALAMGMGGAVIEASPQAPAATARPATTAVNLNTATAVELERLPGVGPAMATRILAYRDKNGGFKKIEELMNVQGIGEKRFLELKAQITVTPPKAAER